MNLAPAARAPRALASHRPSASTQSDSPRGGVAGRPFRRLLGDRPPAGTGALAGQRQEEARAHEDGLEAPGRESVRHPRPDDDEQPRDEAARDDLGEQPAVGLDPLERALWQAGAPSPFRGPSPAIEARPVVRPPVTPALEALVDRFVKRFAMSGDRHRGTAHLAVGAGEMAGGTLTVHAEAGRVTVIVDAPPGVDATRFGEGLRERLQARGLDVAVETR